MAQVFYASPSDTMTWPNGAVGHRPGGPMDRSKLLLPMLAPSD